MGYFKRVLVAFITVAVLAVPAQGHAHPRHKPTHVGSKHHQPKFPADYLAWSRVARCESGGWVVLGSAYPDSLGITRTNYIRFGGRPLPPGRVSRAGIVAQIRVADRLVNAYHMSIPDQGGCAAW